MSRSRIDLDALSFRATMTGLAVVAMILLLAPTVIVVAVSFTSAFSLKFPPPGFSLRWYVALAEDWQLQFAAWNSFKVALWATVLSIVLGVAAALAIARSRIAAARVLDQLFMSP